MRLTEYIKELRRRNVIKAAIAYLIVAWVILQVGSIVFPLFEAPPYALKILLLLLIVGFVFWVAFSWVYDVTDDGIRKTDSVEKAGVSQARNGRRLNRVIIGGLSLAVLVLLYFQFTSNEEADVVVDSPTVVDSNAASKVAVLPFLNTKPDEQTDYLGFALADQIIGGLVYANSLTVRPSSSVRKYEKMALDPKSIGQELDVEYLLHGNYLMEGDVIRLNVELINTADNSIIIREPLELGFASAFELQDLVSNLIIDKLRLHFSMDEQQRMRRNAPQNALAYEYYLRAISYPQTNDDSELAVEMLLQSIALDSLFAPAYDELGSRSHTLSHYGLKGEDEALKAEAYHLKALELNDELVSAYHHLSTLYVESGRISEAIDMIQSILEISPNNGLAHNGLSYVYRYAGLLEESIQANERAVELDNSQKSTVGIAYLGLARYDEAYMQFEQINDRSLGIAFQGIISFRKGDHAAAMQKFEQVAEMDNDGLNHLWVKTYIGLINGDKQMGLQAARAFEAYEITDSEAWFFIARNYALLGDPDGAVRCLQRAIDGGYYNYPFMVNDSFFDAVRDDERFQGLLRTAEEHHLNFKRQLASI